MGSSVFILAIIPFRHIVDRAVKFVPSLNSAHRVDLSFPEAEGVCSCSFDVADEFINNV